LPPLLVLRRRSFLGGEGGETGTVTVTAGWAASPLPESGKDEEKEEEVSMVAAGSSSGTVIVQGFIKARGYWNYKRVDMWGEGVGGEGAGAGAGAGGWKRMEEQRSRRRRRMEEDGGRCGGGRRWT